MFAVNSRLPRHPAVVYLLLVRSMEIKLPLTFVVIIFSTILLSLGCQKRTIATNPGSRTKTDLHESTKPLQAADMLGYDGTKLRKSVDHLIKTNDKHEQEIQKMIERGPDQ
jgi:hypothetical protein